MRSRPLCGGSSSFTIDAVQEAAHVQRLEIANLALAKAQGISAQAASKAVQEVSFEDEAAIRTNNRLIIADMNLAKAEGLAKLAKDAAAIENILGRRGLGEARDGYRSGASRGLRAMGLFLDLNRDIERQQKLTGRTLSESEVIQFRYNAVMREGAEKIAAFDTKLRRGEARRIEQMWKAAATRHHSPAPCASAARSGRTPTENRTASPRNHDAWRAAFRFTPTKAAARARVPTP